MEPNPRRRNKAAEEFALRHDEAQAEKSQPQAEKPSSDVAPGAVDDTAHSEDVSEGDGLPEGGVQEAELERRKYEVKAEIPSELPGEVGAEEDTKGPGRKPARSAPQNPDAEMLNADETE